GWSWWRWRQGTARLPPRGGPLRLQPAPPRAPRPRAGAAGRFLPADGHRLPAAPAPHRIDLAEDDRRLADHHDVELLHLAQLRGRHHRRLPRRLRQDLAVAVDGLDDLVPVADELDPRREVLGVLRAAVQHDRARVVHDRGGAVLAPALHQVGTGLAHDDEANAGAAGVA